jgi:arginine utilization regulatory protein
MQVGVSNTEQLSLLLELNRAFSALMELENEIERAVALTPEGDTITLLYLSERIITQKAVRVSLPVEAGTLKQARLTFEREYVAEVLRQHHGNAVQAAKALGISRQMLQTKIKEYGLRAR